jgi:glycerol-3-phosphate acyltransferase PlsY
MFSLVKVLHVLALGLWFGGVVCFSFVGLSLFETLGQETAKPTEERPYWLPVPPQLETAAPSARFPTPLRKEQGSRIAGAAVGPMFEPYYIAQLACGGVALLTALAFAHTRRANKVRVFLLILAIVGAFAGWWLDGQVEALREKRSATSDALLLSTSTSEPLKTAADDARASFGLWHGYSLLANFGTLTLVTAAMAMAAFLPGRKEAPC